MKKLILLAGAAALASCGGGSEDVAIDNAMTADDTAMTADATPAGDSYVGTHTVYSEDGEMLGTTVANADGSYTDTNADGTTGAGTWEKNAEGQLCFDEDGDEAGATCWTRGEETDGRIRWTNPDGEVVMVAFSAA